MKRRLLLSKGSVAGIAFAFIGTSQANSIQKLISVPTTHASDCTCKACSQSANHAEQ